MSSSSSLRLAAYFLTALRRFFSRLIRAVFAMVICPLVPARLRSVSEREAEGRKQGLGLGIVLRVGGDGDVHAPDRVDLVVFDLGKNDLLLDADVVVAA